MGINYHPEPGDILFCAFPDPGTQRHAPPEMVKHRQVVALSPRFRRHVPMTIIVVPLSTTAPSIVEPYHYELIDTYTFLSKSGVWVKGDMISNVSLGRLKPLYRQGKAVRGSLSSVDLLGTRKAVAQALGIAPLDERTLKS